MRYEMRDFAPIAFTSGVIVLLLAAIWWTAGMTARDVDRSNREAYAAWCRAYRRDDIPYEDWLPLKYAHALPREEKSE